MLNMICSILDFLSIFLAICGSVFSPKKVRRRIEAKMEERFVIRNINDVANTSKCYAVQVFNTSRKASDTKEILQENSGR